MNESIESVCSSVIEDIKDGVIDRDNLENKKLQYCGEYNASKVPKNSTILNYSNEEEREEVRKVLKTSPVRSASGVSPVTIMTHPVNLCPHGRCYFCPAGKDSIFDDTQLSYPGGPCLMRAKKENYDPYGQVMRRLSQLHYNGHNVDKIELIIKSATVTSRSHDYQNWFVKRALQAMNNYNPNKSPNEIKDSYEQENTSFEYLEDVIKENEKANVRCIGITFETKPDWCGIEQLDRMLNLGVTKTEIGVQTTFDEINNSMNRGHGKKESIKANRILRDSGMKVGFHMMPGLPGSDEDLILEDFERIFEKQEWKPDYLKIYPALVIRGTKLYDMWRKDEYEPLTSEEASEIVAKIKEKIPKYVRLQRVQRDIPADQIEAGVQKSNLRQLANKELEDSCDCIRCREVGLNDNDVNIQDAKLNVMSYKACSGIEKFISIEERDSLIGFGRLRLPNKPHRKELQNSSILRELHVYGNEVSLDDQNNNDYQHKGFGKKIMKKAEEISRDYSKDKISVISGIGVREYYREKLGYVQNGPYVEKEL
jgi:elongator complex protein 3